MTVPRALLPLVVGLIAALGVACGAPPPAPAPVAVPAPLATPPVTPLPVAAPPAPPTTPAPTTTTTTKAKATAERESESSDDTGTCLDTGDCYDPAGDAYREGEPPGPGERGYDENGDGESSGYERCGTACGEEPTSGESQYEYGCAQGYITGGC